MATTSTRPRQGLALVISIAVPFIIGGLGALSTAGNVDGGGSRILSAETIGDKQ